MMTREDYIKICGTCTKRSFDPNQGLVCSISKEIASFDGDCSDYQEDEIEKERTIINPIHAAHIEEENDTDQKDMLFGALWCIGGLAATMADIGYIFWGAIIFGAGQFIKGMSNYSGK